MKKIFQCLIVVVLLLVAAGLALLYSGLYDVAATSPHSFVFKEAVNVLVERSVERRAATVQVPRDFEAMDMQPGFEHYDHMCVGCHGAPGVEPEKIIRHMNPEPPDLTKTADELSPAEIYWIVVHGLKMTGMPGILEIAGEPDRWQIVAFVNRLPKLTAEEYRALQVKAGASGAEHYH